MKKYMKWTAIAFFGWFLLTQPHKAAGMVHGTLGSLTDAAGSMSTFVSDLP